MRARVWTDLWPLRPVRPDGAAPAILISYYATLPTILPVHPVVGTKSRWRDRSDARGLARGSFCAVSAGIENPNGKRGSPLADILGYFDSMLDRWRTWQSGWRRHTCSPGGVIGRQGMLKQPSC